jgi:hypothetical protein
MNTQSNAHMQRGIASDQSHALLQGCDSLLTVKAMCQCMHDELSLTPSEHTPHSSAGTHSVCNVDVVMPHILFSRKWFKGIAHFKPTGGTTLSAHA